jgi:hypothetical protein
MRSLAVCFTVAWVILPGVAAAASVEDLFRQFNLFGNWATECDGPPSPSNPHVSIVTPSAGLVLEDHNLGPDFAVNRYSVLSAEPQSSTTLSVHVIFQPGTEVEERQKLIFLVRDNTRRTIYNETDSGVVRVKDGIAVVRGTKTPVLRKCGADKASIVQ